MQSEPRERVESGKMKLKAVQLEICLQVALGSYVPPFSSPVPPFSPGGDDMEFILERTRTCHVDLRDLSSLTNSDTSRQRYGIVSFSSGITPRTIEELFQGTSLGWVAIWLLRRGGYDESQVWRECGIRPKVQRQWAEAVESEIGTGNGAIMPAGLPERFPGVPANKVAIWLLKEGGASLRRIQRDTGIPRNTVQRWSDELNAMSDNREDR